MSGYEITPLRPELLEHVAKLARRMRGRTVAQQIAYFDWKYLRNPYISEPLMYLALHKGRAVGMRGFYGTCWQAGKTGRRYVFPAASDSAIDEEHRSGDLYRALNETALAEARRRGFTHLVNLSSTPEHGLTAMLTFGWKGIVPHDVMSIGEPEGPPIDRGPRVRRRVPAPVRTALRLGRRQVQRLARPGPHLFATLDRSVLAQGDGSSPTIRVTQSAAELADVAARVPIDERLQLVRDESFFKWRFANPLASYRFVISEVVGQWGYLVLYARPSPATVLVLDWQATSEEAEDKLIATALDRGQLARVSAWSASLSHRQVETLKARGFAPAQPTGAERRRKALLVRPVSDAGDDEQWELDGLRLDAASSWNVTATGSDAY